MAIKIDELKITFPAKAGYLMISRLNAAALGSAAGFDIDELDDLRLAVNEAASWLLADEEAGGQIELVLSAADGHVRISGTRSGSGLPPRRQDDLIEAILGATVDEYSLSEDKQDERFVLLVKAKAPGHAE